MNRSGTSAVSGQNPWVSKQKSMRIAAVAVIIESLKSSQRYVWSLGWFFCRARKGSVRNRNISGLEPKRQGFGRLGSQVPAPFRAFQRATISWLSFSHLDSSSLCAGFEVSLRASASHNIMTGLWSFRFEVLMHRLLDLARAFQLETRIPTHQQKQFNISRFSSPW